MHQQQYIAQIQQIFNTFDKDHSGTIELAELKKVSQALGEDLSESQLRQIVKMLDTNKDGRISFEEFKFWWLYGQKGKMNDLVFLRAKSMKLTNGFFKKFEQAGVDLTKFNQNQKVDKIQIDISFGVPIKQGIMLDVSVCHRGQKFTQQINNIKKLVPSINQASVNILVFLPAQNPKKVEQELKSIISSLVSFLPFPIQSLQENPFACIKILALKDSVVLHVESKQTLNTVFNDPLNKFDQINQKLDKELFFFAQLSTLTNFSVSQLIKETNLIQTLLKGLSFKLDVEVPSSITKKFREVLQADKQVTKNLENVLMVLLKSLKLKIKLNTPQKIQVFLKKLGIHQLIVQCPSFKNIIQLISIVFDAQQSKKNPKNPMNYLYLFLKLLKNHLKTGVQIYVQRKQTLVKVKAQVPDGSKIFQLLYNQL